MRIMLYLLWKCKDMGSTPVLGLGEVRGKLIRQ